MHAHTHIPILSVLKVKLEFLLNLRFPMAYFVIYIYIYIYIWYLLIFDLYIKLSPIGLLGLLSQHNISYHIHLCGPFIFTVVQLFKSFPGGSVVKNQLCLLFLTVWFCILWLSSGSVWVGSSIPFEYNTIQWSCNLDASRHTDIKAPLGYLQGWNYNPVSSI